MGYTTDFQGKFTLNKPLSDKMFEFLTQFAGTRRISRTLGEEYGVEGEFFLDDGGNMGQNHTPDIIDYNRPPSTQPSLWCQWVPTEDKQGIEWDGNEKFYGYIDWLQYLIVKFLAPNGYVLSGKVKWRGEEFSDTGKMVVVDNILTVSGGNEIKEVTGPVLYEDTLRAGPTREVVIKRARPNRFQKPAVKITVIGKRKLNMED